MAEYLAFRIIEGALEYSFVLSKKPELKKMIDEILKNNGKEYLIIEI